MSIRSAQNLEQLPPLQLEPIDPSPSEEKPKKFRFCKQKAFFTYLDPQLKFKDKQQLLDEFTARLGKEQIRHYILGREVAPSTGTVHYHFAVWFTREIDTRNPKFFDLQGIHPNIRLIRGGQQNELGLYEYITKDDLHPLQSAPFEFIESKDYQKRRSDHLEWRQDRINATLRSPFPFELPCGQPRLVLEPGPRDKKCNYWIYGERNLRKTGWVNATFAGSRVYVRPKDKNYPYDSYDNERVIIIDDFAPKLEELIYMSEYRTITTPYYGSTRYRHK